MIIDNVHVEFAYDPKLYEQLENDLYKFWHTTMPLFALENSFLLNMYHSKQNYFTIPSNKSKNKKRVRYHFSVTTSIENVNMKIMQYKYEGYTFNEADD